MENSFATLCTTENICTTIGAIVGALSLIVLSTTFYRNIKVNKSSYLLTIDKYFAENTSMQEIYNCLSDHDSCIELCGLKDMSSSKLSTYLTFIENFYTLSIRTKIFKIDELYNLFGHRIFSALHNEEIQKREIEKYRDHFENLFVLHKVLFLYCIKNERKIPHIQHALFFVKDNRGNYKEGYKKYKMKIEQEIDKAVKASKLPVKLPTPITNKNTKEKIECWIRQCSINDYERIVEIQNIIMEKLKNCNNKKLFICTENDKIKSFLEQDNIFFICVETSKKEICAYSYTFFKNQDEYDLGYKFKNTEVATFDTVVVLPDFRGNKLQDILSKISINEAKKRCCEIIASTVSPDNIHSVNNFISNDFKILDIIDNTEPYEGYKRYVMYKELN